MPYSKNNPRTTIADTVASYIRENWNKVTRRTMCDHLDISHGRLYMMARRLGLATGEKIDARYGGSPYDILPPHKPIPYIPPALGRPAWFEEDLQLTGPGKFWGLSRPTIVRKD